MIRPSKWSVAIVALLALATPIAVHVMHRIAESDQRPTVPWAALDAALGLLSAEDEALVRRAVSLRLRSALREAHAALEQGDHRLVGVSGIGLLIPGTPERTDAMPFVSRYGIREVLGVGDHGNQYAWLYQSESYEFALRYNLVVLTALKEPTSQ